MIVSTFEDVSLGMKLATAGIAACVADTITFPLDTAKVRLQVQGEKINTENVKHAIRYRSVLQTITEIVKTEGLMNLYSGLSAGLQRQMCFASLRIGMYDSVKTFYNKKLNDEEQSNAFFDILTKISAGITTGAFAVLIAQPTDVVKVRYQSRGAKEKRSSVKEYKTIYKQDGARGLWKGVYPNITRNAIVNVSETVCYDLIKTTILKNQWLPDNTFCYFTSGVITGFFTTVVSSPVDVIKTRYMSSSVGQYDSAVNCAIKTVTTEGISALFKGFTPSFYRLVTWNIIMWISYEKMKIFVVHVLNH